MKFSFKLREPKSAVPTPIYFTVFFKSEKKSLIYSTDKKIHPSDWDFDNNSAKSRQLKFHSNSYTQSLQRELNKISDLFIEIEALAEKHNEKLSSEILKTRLDERLERISTLSTDFFSSV